MQARFGHYGSGATTDNHPRPRRGAHYGERCANSTTRRARFSKALHTEAISPTVDLSMRGVLDLRESSVMMGGFLFVVGAAVRTSGAVTVAAVTALSFSLNGRARHAGDRGTSPSWRRLLFRAVFTSR